MFDSVAVAVSPSRSRLAGPVAAFAHGLVFAGLIGAALWNAADLQLPALPERVTECFPMIPIALSGPAGGTGGGGRRDTAVPRSRPKAAVHPIPERLPDEVSPVSGPEIPIGEGPGQDQGNRHVIGTGNEKEGPGDCPTCPVGPGAGEKGDVVDGTVVAPILVRRVEPNYPEALRKLRLEGRVLLEAIIGRNGSIEEIRVVSSGNVLFTEEAVKAVGQWRYQPCLFAGRPVRVRLMVTVAFRLN